MRSRCPSEFREEFRGWGKVARGGSESRGEATNELARRLRCCPMTLSALESDVLRMLLEGDHPVLGQPRAQLETARAVSRELSGVGFFTEFVQLG